jgi:hypothetical protein
VARTTKPLPSQRITLDSSKAKSNGHAATKTAEKNRVDPALYGKDCSIGAHHSTTISRFDLKLGHAHDWKICMNCGKEIELKGICFRCMEPKA